MPWNVLSSYGENNGSFLDEGEQPITTDSSYKRMTEGHQNNQDGEDNHVAVQDNGQIGQG